MPTPPQLTIGETTRKSGVPPLVQVEQQDAAGELPVTTKDALAGKQGEYDLVLTNPPFGKKSSVTIVGEEGDTQRESLVLNSLRLSPGAVAG